LPPDTGYYNEYRKGLTLRTTFEPMLIHSDCMRAGFSYTGQSNDETSIYPIGQNMTPPGNRFIEIRNSITWTGYCEENI